MLSHAVLGATGPACRTCRDEAHKYDERSAEREQWRQRAAYKQQVRGAK
jgi:hypothetical protein